MRTRYASTPSSTPPPIAKTRASVSARPVAAAGLSRASRTARRFGCLPAALPTLRAAASVGAGRGRLDPRITPHDDSDYKADCQGEHEEAGGMASDGVSLSTSLWPMGVATFPDGRRFETPGLGTCPHRQGGNTSGNVRAFGCVAATRRLAGERLTSGPSPFSCAPRGAGRTVGGRVWRSSPGGRLRGRDARRSGSDRGALDRPRVSRHPGGGAGLGHWCG